MVSAPLRILYLGTPEFAVPSLRQLLDSRHRVVAVISQPDRPRGRGHRLTPSPVKMLAAEHGVPIWQPEKLRDESVLRDVAALQADLGVVAAYGRILPEALLSGPRLGTINVHASLLPRWRGAAPVHRAVMAGDALTGVTIMRVVKALDAGAMFASASRPIGPDETSLDVERDLAALGARLLMEVVEQMAAGTAVETPQDEDAATYAPKILKEEGVVNWDQPAAVVHNLVRGLQPWPLVSGRLAGTRVLLHRTHVSAARTDRPAGIVVQAAGDAFDIACAEGSVLSVLRLQPEGRRVMTAREFLAGRPLETGMRIERG
jgi:methionyl-tRNA formyltransferase